MAKNLPVYTFNYICEQDYSVRLGDEATKVIVNAAGSRNGLSEDMFLSWSFYQRKKQIVTFTKELQGAVNESIAQKEMEGGVYDNNGKKSGKKEKMQLSKQLL